MYTATLFYTFLVAAFSATFAQDFLNFHIDQENARCIGVVCPRDRPRCILEGHLTKCIAVPSSDQQTRTSNKNRLSRAPRPLLGEQRSPSQSPASFPRSQNTRGVNLRDRNGGLMGRINGAPRVCRQPSEPGRCMGYFPRYFYNAETGECESFTYGGCGGNSNNFERFQDCFSSCVLPQTIAGSGGRGRGRSPDRNPFLGRERPAPRGNNNGGSTVDRNGRTTNNGNNRSLLDSINDGFFSDSSNSLLGSSLFLAPQSSFSPNTRGDSRGRGGNSRGSPNRPGSRGGSSNTWTSNSFPGGRGSFSGIAPGGPPPPPRACILDVDIGPCQAAITRFFYNTTSKQCEAFIYGGCQGNDNNFATFDECKRTCDFFDEFIARQSGNWMNNRPSQSSSKPLSSSSGRSSQTPKGAPSKVPAGFAAGAPPPPPATCFQAPERGLCLGNMRRFYYNGNSKQCEIFTYSGCGGNQNNFASLNDCKRLCNYYEDYVDNQKNIELRNPPVNTGSKPSGNPLPPKVSGFADGASPLPPRRCILDPEPGPCFAAIPRFYYNTQTKRCQPFDYGGCAGNNNNFQTLQDCQKTCDYFEAFIKGQSNVSPSQKPSLGQDTLAGGKGFLQTSGTPNFGFPGNTGPSSIQSQWQNSRPASCSLPAKSGPCRAAFRRYFFNQESGRCELFLYGGCQPNENNYMTEAECRQACWGTSTSSSGPSVGGENNNPFLFANDNSDSSLLNGLVSPLDRNLAVLSSVSDRNTPVLSTSNQQAPASQGSGVCSLPVEPGQCFMQITSYYYDIKSESCQPFVYYGCGGNKNRFDSERQCLSACGSTTDRRISTTTRRPGSRAGGMLIDDGFFFNLPSL
ncbi:papilin [Aplysia californica]|uniref:Papilin n=1 Tax=Aplysia californica TaxID=6500 RepID=A0ABM1A840_APLCA|nr:papilin [Aplysia californica]